VSQNPGYEFCVLGGLEVRRNGTPIRLGGRRARQRAVLGCLLVHAGETVSTDLLIDALWGDRPPGSALTVIHGHIANLRRLLEPERGRGEKTAVLTTTPSGYRLHAEAGSVDASAFESLLGQGREALAAGRDADAARLLNEALGLWRGPAFGDLAQESWAALEAGRLDELRLACLEDRIEADLRLGHHEEVVGELEAHIAADPLRERPRGLLMRALYAAGRQAEALDAYREARRVLVDELGLEPSRELRGLEAAILRQDESLTRKPRVRPTAPSLPVSATRFLGRSEELAAVVGRLGRDDVPLLTLSGPGGIGKTRLALEAARVASRWFEHDVTWVPLAGVRESGGRRWPSLWRLV
jgi:DNA-binding SARP family transcriptional activator